MAEPLTFQLKLTDTFSGVLAAPIASIRKFRLETDDLKSAVPLLGKVFERGIRDPAAGAHSFLSFDIPTAAGLAFSAVMRIGTAFVSLGKSVASTLGDFQDLQLAMKLDLGADGAANLQNIADSFGASRFDDDLINKALIPFAQIGVKDSVLLDRIATAAGDLSARLHTGNEGFIGYTEALEKIAQKGEIDPRTFKALTLQSVDYFKNLGSFLGVSAKQAEALQKAGKVDSRTLIATALDEIAKRQGGKLGVGTNEAGKTLGGTLARLEALPGNIFKQLNGTEFATDLQKGLESIIDWGLSGGADTLKDAVRGVGMAFEGAQLGVQSVRRALQSLGFDDIGDAAQSFGRVVGLSFEYIGLGIEGVTMALTSFYGELSDSVTSIVDAFSDIGGFLEETFSTLIEGFTELGGDLIDGLVEGLKAGWTAAKDGVAGIWSGVVADAKAVFEINSPSRAFAEIGGYTAEGLAQGLEGGRDRVESAAHATLVDSVFSGLRSLPSYGPQTSAGSSPAAGANVTVYYTPDPGTSTPQQARELAEEVRKEMARFYGEQVAA